MSAQQPVPAPAGKWKPQVSPPPPPKDGQKWPALRMELQEALRQRDEYAERIAALEAENARLRWAIMGMLRWQWKFYAELHRAVPTLTVNEGIVALQAAIERREGE